MSHADHNRIISQTRSHGYAFIADSPSLHQEGVPPYFPLLVDLEPEIRREGRKSMSSHGTWSLPRTAQFHLVCMTEPLKQWQQVLPEIGKRYGLRWKKERKKKKHLWAKWLKNWNGISEWWKTRVMESWSLREINNILGSFRPSLLLWSIDHCWDAMIFAAETGERIARGRRKRVSWRCAILTMFALSSCLQTWTPCAVFFFFTRD